MGTEGMMTRRIGQQEEVQVIEELGEYNVMTKDEGDLKSAPSDHLENDQTKGNEIGPQKETQKKTLDTIYLSPERSPGILFKFDETLSVTNSKMEISRDESALYQSFENEKAKFKCYIN